MGKKNLTLFVESGGVLHRPELTESEGKSKWSATVWRLGEMNLNGRVYTKELAQRVCAEVKSTIAYDGHDVNWSTGEEYGITKAVCFNPRVEGNEFKVDIEFVDKEYQTLLETLYEKGIAIGVSSVGYGETDPQTGVVYPETYSVVRFLDFVTMPAGQVYAKMGESKVSNNKQREESTDEPRAKYATAEKRSEIAKSLLDIIL